MQHCHLQHYLAMRHLQVCQTQLEGRAGNLTCEGVQPAEVKQLGSPSVSAKQQFNESCIFTDYSHEQCTKPLLVTHGHEIVQLPLVQLQE